MKTTIDLQPLYRKSIGFDRLFNEFETLSNIASNTYPPYNIIKTGENSYSIELAVSGFSMDEIEIIKDKNVLKVSGSKQAQDQEIQYIHKGIATRSFSRSFALADFVEVDDALLENGILFIFLKRIIPEEHMPKRINISVPTLIEK